MVVDVDRQADSIVQDTTTHIVGTRHSLSAFCVLLDAHRWRGFHCPHHHQHHYGGHYGPNNSSWVHIKRGGSLLTLFYFISNTNFPVAVKRARTVPN